MSYIGKAPGVGVRNRYYFTATGGETSISGTDDASNTLAFSDGKYVDVTLNGVTLVAGTDYDTATANTIDNLTALTAGDVVEVVVYDVFSIAAAVPPTGGTFTGLVQFDDQIIIPRGTTAQRPASPVAGSVRFNTTEQRYEGYDGTAWVYLSDAPSVSIEYLVIAGGGGGAGGYGNGNGTGGAGAGGYRSSIAGETSGGGASSEPVLSVTPGTPYTITVGAGGAGGTGTTSGSTSNYGSSGSDSTISSIISAGGGYGASALQGAGGTGGSGGGGGASNVGGPGATSQGFGGGQGDGGSAFRGGGGGGASASGAAGSASGNGGNGLASSVTGVSVTRAGGGGGGVYWVNAGPGAGGAGGGGAGGAGTSTTATAGSGGAGAVNTGSGGGSGGSGAGGSLGGNGGAGGSGVIILKVPAGFSASFSAGVSQTSATVGSFTVYTITAAGASDTVTFS